ncbi:AAA family ATPase [Mesorhizobium sp.]|uniref:AAA family ATPase n=1 Tax=Mesorhizobium sp. TaxID=1871066 RepID=UPI00121E8396|nr:AAA family ATPase [Mesorhizobium sp.]TIS67991.1 MAG: hypothetical protein E5W92_06320 [Mesorhizobium sp.]
MRLVRFTAAGIHGFLKFNIKFDETLTFLTGINGSGKTSALNAIVALITPNFSVLANLEFQKISVEVENGDERITISAEKDGDVNSLSVSTAAELLTFSRYIADEEQTAYKQDEAEAVYYRELLSTNIAHPVLRSIDALPTPMFLGLDRRARFEEESTRYARYGARRPRRLGRNVFGASLARSLDDAAGLAETRYRDALIESGAIAERLQQELLLSLLTFDIGTDRHPYATISAPTPRDLQQLTNVRHDLEALPQILGLPRQEVRRRVTPFLDALQSYADTIPRNVDTDKLFDDQRQNTKVIDALFRWSTNQVHLTKIKAISDIVAKYNTHRASIMKPMSTYLGLVERFLSDSGKSVQFNERGYLYVDIKGLQGERDISFLSSGEAQIFVILTHLSFNRLAQRNVFIIDEPELSLHVQWQEIFVDSVMSANPNIQYIMATHSPSIILERVENCIDLSTARGRGGLRR